MNLGEFKKLSYGQQLKIYTELKKKKIEFAVEMAHRCETDITINQLLWEQEYEYLKLLYDSVDDDISRFIEYSNFKSICVKEQEEIGVRFDKDKCESTIEKLNSEINPKIEKLSSLMPKIEVLAVKTPPKNIYKKDGSYSKRYLDFIQFKKDYNVPDEYEGDIEYVKGYKEPSAASSEQLKNWLFSLGWSPITFKDTENKVGEKYKVPQIYTEDKNICPSIEKLYDKVPELELLDSLGVLKHRVSLLNGFLKSYKEVGDNNLRVYAGISGYTNTMRLRHRKPMVNLPKVIKPYGELIRGCFISDEGYTFLGSDLVGIESVTKNHYIYNYDPVYVETLNDPMYCSHVDIGVLAGLFTKEEGELYVLVDKGVIKDLTEEQKSIIKKVKPLRAKAKNTNYGAQYGQGYKGLSEKSNMPISEAKRLLEIYWQRNWAIRAFADSCQVKNVGNQMWIFNPVSKFWYSLRSSKDRFATVNSSTAVYVFDLWIKYLRGFGVKIQYQCHDEHLFGIKDKKVELAKEAIKESIRLVNEELKLNVEVNCGIASGKTYSECH